MIEAQSEAHMKQGLRRNLKQFTLLVVVNAFVGAMVGIERTLLPELAETEFNVASTTAVLAFIVAFGISKAVANYFAGRLANVYGRKKLLVAGWLLALPVPVLLIVAPAWGWVIAANVILGLNQGLTWSSTVVMKIELVGEKNRGLAMGLNEFAGYAAVGVTAWLAAYIASRYGVTPYPFILGAVVAVVGLLLSVIWVNETHRFAKHEQQHSTVPLLKHVVLDTTFRHRTLSSVTQAGFVNNLNDGMVWGLLPIVLAALQFSPERIGIVAGVYPAVWGISQLFTGRMADRFSHKRMLVWGMLAQALAIAAIPFLSSFQSLVLVSALLGVGTAVVYPTFLTASANATAPVQRAESIGTFRLWRDLGYAAGALVSDFLADVYGLDVAVVSIAAITFLSALVVAVRMPAQR
ncbi:MAG: MFS transporter [Flavobacteriales bacterium]